MIYPSQDVTGNVVGKFACASENSGAPSLVTAGGTGDGVEVEGETLDRMTGTALADSCVLEIGFLAALADTESVSFAVDYQESDDGSTWDTAVELQASTAAATSSGGTNEFGVVDLGLNLRGLKRYVRFNVTCTMSAGATDTALFAAVAVFGGYDQGAV